MKKNNKDIRKLIKYYPSLQKIQAIREGLWNNKSLTILNGESFSRAFDNMWDKCDDETKLNKGD